MKVFSDLSLARRLERTEAEANARFVEARATLFPESGAGWIEVAGAYAMFDGVESPCTQTFGLGVFQPPTAADFETIERFFQERDAPVFHEVSPLADPSTVSLLNQRGYHPIELSSVMFCPIEEALALATPRNPKIQIRLIRKGEGNLWAETAAKGWSDGKAIAAGAVSITGGIALLAGASTIPEARKQGAQLALLNSRLRYAAERGCDIAMMCALPGCGSQRNAERHGFRIAYTRIKWQLAVR